MINYCLRSLCLRHFKDYFKLVPKRHQTMDALNIGEIDPLKRQFNEIDVNSFAEIIESNKSDKKIRNKIEIILNEYEYEKQTTLLVPTTLTTDQMKELLELFDSKDRKYFFNFLYKIEKQKIKQKVKKIEERLKKVPKEMKPIGIWDENHQLIYGLHHNTLFQWISKKSAHRQYVPRLRTAALFGPKLVIDLDFDKYMKKYECRRLLQQLAFLYNYNKYDTRQPFDLHFVNCNEEEISIQEMSRYLVKCNSNDFMVSMHYNKSYLDVFPKEKLVYLSPHSKETLESVSEDDIYIIGALIDKSYRAPITEIKAREDGIRSAKLPITGNVKWIKGSQHLCINQVLAILHDWKETEDWELTLKRHLPARKIFTEEEIEAMKYLSSNDSKFV